MSCNYKPCNYKPPNHSKSEVCTLLLVCPTLVLFGLMPGRCTAAELRTLCIPSEVPVTIVRKLPLPTVLISGVSRMVTCRVLRTLLWLNVVVKLCTGLEVVRVTMETTLIVLIERNGRNRLLLFEH